MADKDGAATISPGGSMAITTEQTFGARTAGASSPSGLVTRPPLMATMGERVLNHDGLQHVIRTPEGYLEFYIGATIVAVLDHASRLHLKGTLTETQTTNRTVLVPALTTDGVIERSAAGPSWAFALVENSQPVQAGTIGPTGNMTMYAIGEIPLPLASGSSPSFGSDYAVNSSGATHISQDRSKSSARLDATYLEQSGTAVAFDTGWTLPTTATEQADSGFAWGSDSNALLNDGNAAISVSVNGGLTKTMHLLNYAFTLPHTGLLRLDGIEVRVSRSEVGTGSNSKDNVVQIVLAGSQTGDNKADTVTLWPDESGDAFVTYGASNDRWSLDEQHQGTAFTASDFGVAFKAENTQTMGNRTMRLQNVQMRLYGTAFTVLPNAMFNIREIIEEAF